MILCALELSKTLSTVITNQPTKSRSNKLNASRKYPRIATGPPMGLRRQEISRVFFFSSFFRWSVTSRVVQRFAIAAVTQDTAAAPSSAGCGRERLKPRRSRIFPDLPASTKPNEQPHQPSRRIHS
ncbi:hypothetical protein CCHR01_17042 [Colletotrichum chrysophilum]|uniref:Uncharacterized protein n=1 Tax=Colletotrichum chrysophilum TaxID=1836956 RepID=A0AAD9A4J0_9PEZI|nr:hypothetical protein CCHR01_17042 [Colletotrichum chrysophilum]